MDYSGLVKEKKAEQSLLDARMEADSNLLYLKKFTLKDAGGQAVPDIINVTLNKPATFGANIIASLGKTNQQTIVESDDHSLDTHTIEEFQDAAFAAADARLEKRPGQALLGPFADTQLCIRGRTARRVLFRMEGGVLTPDIAPWDGRYVYYEMGAEGLTWAAYETTRSRGHIEAEYGIVIKEKQAQVLDVWDGTHNEVWIENKKVLEQGHGYGETPVVLVIVSLGYGNILMDANRIEHEGESIFFLIRDIVPEVNRLATILQTLNMKAVKPPMVQVRKGGGEPSEYEDATGMATITAMDVGEGIAPINYGDAKQAAAMLYNIMERAMEQGSLSSVDMGSLQFPLSAVALVELGEGRDQIFMPRLQAKALLNQATAEMFTRQVLAIGGSVELGVPGHKRTFSTKKLQGEYRTTYKFFNKSPKIDIARMSVAAAAERFYDPETILTDVLQVEDPKTIMQKRYYYLAEKVDPLILRHRIIMNMLKLAEDGDKDAAREAQIMAATMGMTLAQVKAGQLPEPPPEERPPEPMLPLLGEGGRVGGIPSSAQKAAALQKAPSPPVPPKEG